MFYAALLIASSLPFLIADKSDGIMCGDKIPAYLVADNYQLSADTKVMVDDVDEEECGFMCSDNKDDKGNKIECGSYVYEAKTRMCMIYKVKAMPAGKTELKSSSGHRYFEKFCLPEGTAAECGEAPFFRLNQAVLVGFAKNVTRTKSMEMCIQSCLEMNAECRSAMYFSDAGECIMSSASAQDAPDVFVDEEDEKGVVYFENGCVLENQIRTQSTHSATKKGSKKPQESAKILLGAKNETADAKKDKKDGKDTEDDTKATTVLGETSTRRPRIGRPSKHRNGTASSSSSSSSKSGIKKGDAWGSWSEECRSFDERRPCQNGNRVGFQARQCLRTPFECQGPFFRYCISPC